jgi:hypothetical protein
VGGWRALYCRRPGNDVTRRWHLLAKNAFCILACATRDKADWTPAFYWHPQSDSADFHSCGRKKRSPTRLNFYNSVDAARAAGALPGRQRGDTPPFDYCNCSTTCSRAGCIHAVVCCALCGFCMCHCSRMGKLVEKVISQLVVSSR